MESSPADRAGFTLIELLIVLVVIAVLAAIAIPQFAATKGVAFEGSMKEDLRNLFTAQEEYYAARNRYAPSLTELMSETGYRTSRGVTVTIRSGTATGWSATADHGGVPGSEDCGIYYGDGPSPAGLLAGTVGSATAGAPFCGD